MAVPKKRRICVEPPEPQSSDSEESSEPESTEENETMEIIEVEFDVKIPEYDDRQGIKNLLQQLFLKAHIDTFELSDLLIEQKNITGVIKQAEEPDDSIVYDDDDMDVNFGVFSVINLTANKDKNCIKQVNSYLLDHCREVSSKEQYEMFKKILEDTSKPVGLIISERFVNIPPKISVPLYQNLGRDMEKEGCNFTYYIIISKVSNFEAPTNNIEDMEVFLNPEEELISEEAEFAFGFKVEGEQDSGLGGKWRIDDDEGYPKRKVLVIPANKWEAVCNKLSAELGNY